MRRARAINLIFLAIGAVGLAFLIVHTGADRLLEGLANVGLAFPFVCAVHLFAIVADSVMLWACSGKRAPLRAALRASLAGHAINEATPLAKLGELTKFSLLSEEMSADRAAAALIVQNIAMFVTGCISIAFGAIVTMLAFTMPENLSRLLVVSAAVFSALGLGALVVLTLRIGQWPFSVLTFFRLRKQRIERWRARWIEVEAHWQTVARDRSLMVVNWAAAVVSRLCSVAQAAIILAALGSDHVVAAAFMSTASFQLILWGTSFIPMQVGSHEAGAYALFGAVGLSPDAGLLLELVRKLRRLVFVFVGVAVLGVATFRAMMRREEREEREEKKADE